MPFISTPPCRRTWRRRGESRGVQRRGRRQPDGSHRGLDSALAVLALISFDTAVLHSAYPDVPAGQFRRCVRNPRCSGQRRAGARSAGGSGLECGHDRIPEPAVPARSRFRDAAQSGADGIHACWPGRGARRIRTDGCLLRRARAGRGGLIVTGGIAPNDEARPHPGGAKLSSEDELAGHRVVTGPCTRPGVGSPCRSFTSVATPTTRI